MVDVPDNLDERLLENTQHEQADREFDDLELRRSADFAPGTVERYDPSTGYFEVRTSYGTHLAEPNQPGSWPPFQVQFAYGRSPTSGRIDWNIRVPTPVVAAEPVICRPATFTYRWFAELDCGTRLPDVSQAWDFLIDPANNALTTTNVANDLLNLPYVDGTGAQLPGQPVINQGGSDLGGMGHDRISFAGNSVYSCPGSTNNTIGNFLLVRRTQFRNEGYERDTTDLNQPLEGLRNRYGIDVTANPFAGAGAAAAGSGSSTIFVETAWDDDQANNAIVRVYVRLNIGGFAIGSTQTAVTSYDSTIVVSSSLQTVTVNFNGGSFQGEIAGFADMEIAPNDTIRIAHTTSHTVIAIDDGGAPTLQTFGSTLFGADIEHVQFPCGADLPAPASTGFAIVAQDDE